MFICKLSDFLSEMKQSGMTTLDFDIKRDFSVLYNFSQSLNWMKSKFLKKLLITLFLQKNVKLKQKFAKLFENSDYIRHKQQLIIDMDETVVINLLFQLNEITINDIDMLNETKRYKLKFTHCEHVVYDENSKLYLSLKHAILPLSTSEYQSLLAFTMNCEHSVSKDALYALEIKIMNTIKDHDILTFLKKWQEDYTKELQFAILNLIY